MSFTYIELMDKTTYLNHYYFISVVSFMLIFLPANAHFSLDNIKKKKKFQHIHQWQTDALKLMIGIVYFYAGLAKINSDWLFKAMPLKIWLRSKYDMLLIGNNLMQYDWFHYAMSWGGMLYDLCIPFILLNKKWRSFGFVLVVFFHVFTRILFPIGMFPYVMIISSLIFFEATLHHKIIGYIRRLLKVFKFKNENIEQKKIKPSKQINKWIIGIVLVIQLTVPFRYLLYPGELFWTEEGYRFSWRVMLAEKVGYTQFKLIQHDSKKAIYINNRDFLTAFQEKQMSFQADMILEYAHFLGEHFRKEGYKNFGIYTEAYVALNGRKSQAYINPETNLLNIDESLHTNLGYSPLKVILKAFSWLLFLLAFNQLNAQKQNFEGYILDKNNNKITQQVEVYDLAGNLISVISDGFFQISIQTPNTLYLFTEGFEIKKSI